MNETLIQLLKTIPGISQTRNGIRYKAISHSDSIHMLTMKDDQRDISIGKWVTITRGIYKGDVVLIIDADECGVYTLVLPRFTYSSSKSRQKRKATAIRPQPELFDPSKLDETMTEKLQLLDDDVRYRLGPYNFEHGLLLQEFNFASIGRPATTMTWQDRSSFILSAHPSISRFPPPHPTEWIFTENEQIMVIATKKIGSIIHTDAEYADVDIPLEGTHRILKTEIQKHFIRGSYLRITAGPHRGKEGWVTTTGQQTASVYIDSPENKIDNDTYKSTAQVTHIPISKKKKERKHANTSIDRRHPC
jgi:ribosomal protein L24